MADTVSVHIRKCASDINGKPTKGFVIVIEMFGFLAELAFTRG